MRFESSGIVGPLSNWRRAILNNCLRFVSAALPERCILCEAPASKHSICAQCRDGLPWLPPEQCPQCALPSPRGRLCGGCLSHPPRFDAISAAFIYEWPLAPLIHRYKYGGNLALAGLFAHSLAMHIRAPVDLIVPMPLAPLRLAERGFNQALEIARVVSLIKQIPLAPHACRRVRESVPQATLPWNERARNIRGAFVCDSDVRGLSVAVVDDVLTTGATLNELARNLRKAGAREVHGWMVARTVKRT